MKRDFSDEGYLAPEAKVPGAEPHCSWDWFAAGQVLLKLLKRCKAVQDDSRTDIQLLQQIANAMCRFPCFVIGLQVVSRLLLRHESNDLMREDNGRPQDLILKLIPLHKTCEVSAADDSFNKCSLAVFAFIQSFFSS